MYHTLLMIEMTEATSFWHNSIYRSLEILLMSDSRWQPVWAITLYMCAKILTFAEETSLKLKKEGVIYDNGSGPASEHLCFRTLAIRVERCS